MGAAAHAAGINSLAKTLAAAVPSLHELVVTGPMLRLTAYCKAAAALNTRREGGLKAKRDGIDVEHNEGSVQSYQEQEDVQ